MSIYSMNKFKYHRFDFNLQNWKDFFKTIFSKDSNHKNTILFIAKLYAKKSDSSPCLSSIKGLPYLSNEYLVFRLQTRIIKFVY